MANKSFISRMFGRKRRLEDIDVEELNREQVRLRREEQRLAQRIEQHERDKANLFELAVGKDSKRQKTSIARRIKEIDAAARHDENLLRGISTQVRVLNGVVKLKEDRRFRERFQMLGLLKKMDVSDLAQYIEGLAVEGDITDEKLEQMMRTLEEGHPLSAQREDPDVEEIVAAIEEAATATSAGNEMAKTRGLEKVNRILDRGVDERRVLEEAELV